jgi:Family of unknown function (DUF6209)
MIERRMARKPAQITFTYDFHEVVTGDLRPGHPVVLSYDPKRIIPEGEPYVLGHPEWPVNASVQFRDGEPETNVVLESPGGLVKEPDEDITGQGSMLKAQLMVPDEADLVIVWFSYLSRSGAMVYDNDHGTNYYFGFPSRDIAVLSATVDSDPQTLSSGFAVSVAAAVSVEAVSVRYRSISDPKAKKAEVKLEKTGQSDDLGRPIWSVAGVAVPYRSVVRFKVFYWIGGRRFKDDNSGHYYLAPQPPAEEVPLPPKELVDAAAKW